MDLEEEGATMRHQVKYMSRVLVTGEDTIPYRDKNTRLDSVAEVDITLSQDRSLEGIAPSLPQVRRGKKISMDSAAEGDTMPHQARRT